MPLPINLRRLILVAAAVPLWCLPSPAPGAVAPRAPNAPTNCPPEIQLLQPGVTLSVFAEHPHIVTPTGIGADPQGRVWAVASHTHFRPKDYPGPAKDQVLVFADRDRDGRAEAPQVFYANTEATMDLELGRDGWVYLSERSRVLRVRDTDGDGRGDREENLAVLKTEADYPHNGISGLAWQPDGDLIFALGENYWRDWTLTGSDGTQLRGTGEGGIFRCRPDGAKLRRIAHGFWNPFGVCVRPDGEMFAAENDPGSRPPCKLLHIVEGGDYGYQRLYGEAPFHPFVAWNGELRGTLPMISPSGEAPCGIVPLGGGVIVPSWSDNRLDFFPLKRKGASYTSERVGLVQGGDCFRPTCIVKVSEKLCYLADWVYGSYELHQRGRIWKLEIDRDLATWLQPAQPEPPNRAAKLAEQLRQGAAKLRQPQLLALAKGADPFLARAALQALARSAGQWTPAEIRKLATRDRVSSALALRLALPRSEPWVRFFLGDDEPEVRFEALRWISDEQLKTFEPDVQQFLRRSDLEYPLFEACLATLNTLAGNPRAGIHDTGLLVERVMDTLAPAKLRAYALRLLPPEQGKLTLALLKGLLALNDDTLATEVVRTLNGKGTDAARQLLAGIAGDEHRPAALRAEAILGLAAVPEEHLDQLLNLAQHENRAVREEALRALRFTALNAPQQAKLRNVAERFPASAELASVVMNPAALSTGRPPLTDWQAWRARIQRAPGPADPAAGRRIFFHTKVALCSTCHRHSGRGNVVGPDLSAVADRGDSAWLLRSILQPNSEVAPQFFPWSVELKDGTEFVGIALRKGGSTGKEYYRDVTGKEQGLPVADIVVRRELKSSLMPEGLILSLTDGELRDLLAFLEQGHQ